MTEQDMVDIVQSENAALCRTIEQLIAEIERLRTELDAHVKDWRH